MRLIARDNRDETAEAENFISTGAWVSTIVLTEAIWVLASVYNIGPASQATAVEMLLNHRDLTIHDREAVAAALALFRAKPTLDFQIASFSRWRGKQDTCLWAPSIAPWAELPVLSGFEVLGSFLGDDDDIG